MKIDGKKYAFIMITIIFVLLFVTNFVSLYNDEYYYETESIEATITEKSISVYNEDNIINGRTYTDTKYSYYIMVNGYMVSVEKNIYNDTYIDQNVTINKITKYRKFDDSIVETYYTYSGPRN